MSLKDTKDRFTDSVQYGEPPVTGGGSGTPGDTVVSETTFGQAAAAGVATEYSRRDHTHGTPAAPTPASIGAAAASHTHAESDVTGLVADLAAKITQDGNARVAVAKAGTLVGTRRKVNLIEGSNVTITVADDGANEKVDVTIAAAGGGGGIADGDKGDITVSGSGATWTIDAGVVTFAKMQSVATDTLVGRATAGSGSPETITCTAAGRALLDDVSASAQRTTLGLGSVATLSEANVRSIPQNSQTAAYVLVAGDAGKHISITTGGVTVNASVFSAGDVVTIFNNSSSSQTITSGTNVTLRQAGTANTGNRTLAQYGVCTILCVTGGSTPTLVISGAGLS